MESWRGLVLGLILLLIVRFRPLRRFTRMAVLRMRTLWAVWVEVLLVVVMGRDLVVLCLLVLRRLLRGGCAGVGTVVVVGFVRTGGV